MEEGGCKVGSLPQVGTWCQWRREDADNLQGTLSNAVSARITLRTVIHRDAEQAEEKIDYQQTEYPIKAALDIVNVFAIFRPTAKVTRLITSFNKAANMRRRKNETLPYFVFRHHVAASEDLKLMKLTHSLELGQLFLIKLFHKVNLPDIVLTIKMLQLITNA